MKLNKTKESIAKPYTTYMYIYVYVHICDCAYIFTHIKERLNVY